MRIEAVIAFPDRERKAEVEMTDGSTVADALRRLADVPEFQDINLRDFPMGVFGERCDDARVLQDGDRLEFYRPLLTDPKERRRRVAEENRVGRRKR